MQVCVTCTVQLKSLECNKNNMMKFLVSIKENIKDLTTLGSIQLHQSHFKSLNFMNKSKCTEIYSAGQSTWESYSCWHGQEVSCYIEIKVHYHFCNSLPIDLILSQCNQSVSWHPISSWTILTVSFHICLCLIHDYSLSYFLTKILCEFLICHLFYISCTLCHILDWLDEEHKLWRFLPFLVLS